MDEKEIASKDAFLDHMQTFYELSLQGIDEEVPKLFAAGKVLAGINAWNQSVSLMVSIHSSIYSVYSLLHSHQGLLLKYGSPAVRKRSKSLLKLNADGVPSDAAEAKVLMKQLSREGFNRKHASFNPVLLSQIGYMLNVISETCEPEFFDFVNEPEEKEESPERQISRQVKLAVWRRDGGKCVECGSRQRLEYDHIIPVVHGGSSTERNIQLLCQDCNRRKGASIQ